MPNHIHPDSPTGRATAPGLDKQFTIRAQGLVIKSAKVHWIINWGSAESPDWHTEFTCTKGVYRNYKQSSDGGTITFHD